MASSMIFSLLPVFIVDELGGNSKSFGALEGAVIFLSFMAKLFAGFIMDIFRRKLPMLNAGTILTVFSKLSLACAPSVFFVFISKSLDRFAKGLRQAPSDTILAEISEKKGFAYSLRYTTNISGFLFGSIVTSGIVAMIGKNFRLIFSLAIIPAVIALFILRTKIKYEDTKKYELKEKQKWNIRDVKNMPKAYWKFIILISLLMFNRFSEGFITLRAKEVIPDQVGNFPLFMGIYELCAISIAILVGRISDQTDKRKLMLFGICLLIIADLFGVFANGIITTIFIYVFAGLHIGMTQGLIGSIIAKLAPKNLIGSAFAIFYGIEGLILLLSNNLAGFSSDLAKAMQIQGTAAPFICGALFSLASIMYIYSWIQREKGISI
ncbi:MAG: MFS transporter [Alphaproteobacteria bacterium]|nr:MFS transporter [Alphaproteobacteria bacterium]